MRFVQRHFPFHAAPDIAETLVTGREREYLSWFYRNDAYNPAAFAREEIDEYVRAYSAPGALRAGFEYYRAFPEDETHNRKSAQTRLQMPVLALDGANSRIHNYPFVQLQAVGENVRHSTIEQCGHWLPTERPDQLAQQLLNFFSEE